MSALRHALGLKADGTVVASGNNFSGRISGTSGWKDIVVPER